MNQAQPSNSNSSIGNAGPWKRSAHGPFRASMRRGPRQARVLVIEDEPRIRELLEAVLHDEGYDVVVAGDGMRGLETATSLRPDLIISDVMLPRLSGVALLQRLRLDRDLARIPVILMSAVTTNARRLGAPFLRKPFDIDDLLALVQRELIGARAS